MSAANKSLVSIERLEDRIAPAFAAVVDLLQLNGANGFKIGGVAVDDQSGLSVSDAGDINGDGFGDLIIGAPTADPHGTSSGAAYVVFGKADGFAANLNLSALNGTNGFKISGVESSHGVGRSVSSAGDINGDGFDDLIVSGGFPGSHVIFGKAGDFAANLDLASLNGSNGFRFSETGNPVSAAGDVNGDGMDDVIIGIGDANQSFVHFGRKVYPAVLEVTALDGSNGFVISGEANTRFGNSVSGADLNGDGFDDLIIGAPDADPNDTNSGASYVVFGKASGFPADLSVGTLNGANGFKVSGVSRVTFSGNSVSSAGDVNNDGFADLIIGATATSFAAGKSYVIFGKPSGFTANLNISALNGGNGFAITGETGDSLGGSVSGAGDVNGDGFEDLIIGAGAASPNGVRSGASYIVFGKAGGFAANLNVATLNGSTGFKIGGVAANDSLSSVSAAGDVNNDGFGDIIIGAPGADPNGSNSGASYVIFGESTATFSIGNAIASEGDASTTELTFTVSLSAASTVPLSVSYRTQSGTALADDFSAVTGQVLVFAPGETSKAIVVQVIGDKTHEADETFAVVLSAPTSGATLSPTGGTATGAIRNDDLPPLVSIAGASIMEGDAGTGGLVFTVSLSAASALPAAVNFSTADGTALAISDYDGLTGTLSFAPGETSKTITVAVLGDDSIEDHESISVVLSEASGATIGTGAAGGIILNDDTALRITGPGSLLEGQTAAMPYVFTVLLEKASALPLSVSFATSDGTAIAGSDYTALWGIVSFAPGETEKTINIEVIGDAEIEAMESFSVSLFGPTNATIANGLGTAAAAILNDDTSVSITNASLLEGHSGIRSLSFTVSLAAESALPVTVEIASVGGSATEGSDYAALAPGTITFAPGETTRSILIDILGDLVVETPFEEFSLLLSSPSNASLEDPTGIGTILDDDVTLVSKRKVTFIDIDGDVVTISVNKGTLKVDDFTIFPSKLGSQLAHIDFIGDTDFAGANLTIISKTSLGSSGNGFVDVGFIDAIGVDLRNVTVDGDLGRIRAGNDVDRRPGVQALKINTLGAAGLSTQLADGTASLESTIAGALKNLQAAGNVQDVMLSVSGDIGLLLIKGSLIGSTIASDGRIGPVRIAGDLKASATQSALLSARGILNPTSNGQAMGFVSLFVGGSVEGAQILAGYDRAGAAVNGDVRVGPVMVKGDWSGSNLIVGVAPNDDEVFGSADDSLIPNSTPIIAKIASILIKGSVLTTANDTDRFGFIAEQIGSFRAAGLKLQLTAGPGNDLAPILLGALGDAFVWEVV